MLPIPRSRIALLVLGSALISLVLYSFRSHVATLPDRWNKSSAVNDAVPEAQKGPKYKPKDDRPIPPPLPEYFPLAAAARSPVDLPPVPSWNRPPHPHVPESTRLYIAFTRYWPLLQQVVVSYIAAGWPPEDIYVVENTGTFDANKHGRLTSQNPFYLDYHRLTKIFGVNVITTPSLQTFAQLQNFYISEAIANNLTHYFWGHMDVIAIPHEDKTPYRSLYQIAVDVIRECAQPDYGRDPETGKKRPWAVRFFSYDWLTLVNVESYQKLGGWDTMISYYGTDCDMHSRFTMNGMLAEIADAADIYDTSQSLPDLERLYRRRQIDYSKASQSSGQAHKADTKGGDTHSSVHSPSSSSSDDNIQARSTNETKSRYNALTYHSDTEEDERGSADFLALRADAEAMQTSKRTDPVRNAWQTRQRGGHGEPYHYDADGWEKALQMIIENGVRIGEEKWGHRGCDLLQAGLKEGDQWHVEHDF